MSRSPHFFCKIINDTLRTEKKKISFKKTIGQPHRRTAAQKKDYTPAGAPLHNCRRKKSQSLYGWLKATGGSLSSTLLKPAFS